MELPPGIAFLTNAVGGSSKPICRWGFGRDNTLCKITGYKSELIGLRSPTRSLRDLDLPCREMRARNREGTNLIRIYGIGNGQPDDQTS
jgi:hypothetical protein